MEIQWVEGFWWGLHTGYFYGSITAVGGMLIIFRVTRR